MCNHTNFAKVRNHQIPEDVAWIILTQNLKSTTMKTMRKLKKYLRILEKKKREICYEIELDQEVIERNLYIAYEWEMRFRKAVEEVRIKKQFRKALAERLGVEYSEVKHLFPIGVNSTLIANCLSPYLGFYSHEEIRDICQGLKLAFGFP